MTEEKALKVQEKEVAEMDAERTREQACFVPRVDIYENDDTIFLTADMPGADESSVDISIENNVLTISGNVEPMQPEGYSLTYSEYRVGDYQRSFSVSSQVDQENIKATLKDGVLYLELPKVGPTTKKIAVKAG